MTFDAPFAIPLSAAELLHLRVALGASGSFSLFGWFRFETGDALSMEEMIKTQIQTIISSHWVSFLLDSHVLRPLVPCSCKIGATIRRKA